MATTATATKSPLISFEALFCEEDEQQWGDIFDNEDYEIIESSLSSTQDLLWEDEELLSLFSKETETLVVDDDDALFLPRTEAVLWILKVNDHYGFLPLTAILAVNYLDRFISGLHYQEDKAWSIQLAAVACLSLAAKVEETHVPLLLDFQVEDTEYMFDAKTIQRMELLVLSTLKWRMNPVTPISFLDHITRRLGLKNNLHWEFFTKCQSLIVSFLSDSRFVRFMPSVLATATMLHVIGQVEPSNAVDYQNQLLDVLKISKEKVNDCYELIKTVSSSTNGQMNNNVNKRKYDDYHHHHNPYSPNAVIDTMFLSCDETSNDSWDWSPEQSRLYKKMRVDDLSGMSRVFVDVVESPR